MPDLASHFLPYQVRWINDDAPVAVGEKSRRIGWTYASAFRAVARRLKHKTNLYFTSADLTAAREFVDYCLHWARAANEVAEDRGLQTLDEADGAQAFVLRFTNGARIVAGSSNPKFFRSKGGDADADEFAFHREGRELYKAMQPASLFWGHQLRLWSTHNGEGNYFQQMLKRARAGEIRAGVHRVTILDAVEQGIVEKIKGLTSRDEKARRDWLDEIRATVPDEDAWNEEYMCRPSSGQSALLSYDLIAACEAPNLQLVDDVARLPTDGVLYAGFDVGRKHDLSVLWVAEKVGDVSWTRMLKPLPRMNYTAQEELMTALMRRPAVRRLCIDSTGIGAMLAERLATRFGHRVEPVHFTAPVKSDLAMPLLRLFQDRLVRIPADPAVREDLHKVRKVVTASNNVRLEASRDEGGHADRFWALALACHAAQEAHGALPAPVARKPINW
jgi:phage FluMu gp28-like protein